MASLLRLLIVLVTSAATTAELVPLITFSYSKQSESVLPGMPASECKNTDEAMFQDQYLTSSEPPEAAVMGDVALLANKYQKSCWTDGRYNDKNFTVEKGTLKAGAKSYTAYQIYPGTVKATKFTGSKAEIYFRAPVTADLFIYRIDSMGVTLVKKMSAKADVFVQTGIFAEKSGGSPISLVFDTSGDRMNAWPLLSSSVDGAFLASATGFSITARRFQVTGHPFNFATGWNNGPNTHSGNYGTLKKFFPVSRNDGREGVVWQDQTTKKVSMTWFATDMLSSESKEISADTEHHLMAAAADGVNHIIMIFVSATKGKDKFTGTSAKIVKVQSTTGAKVLSKALDTQKSAMNIYQYSGSGASMVWNTKTGKLLLAMARTYTQGNDGLTHQGGGAFLFDASTLALEKNFGQTSGHSFANSLTLASDGTYLGMDLGDNYPRGINMWRFDTAKKIGGGLVYAFKTNHASKAQSPSGKAYPAYTEISGNGKTYYKWSNDNKVYTELAHAGLIEVDDGILTFFAGEKPPLDNSKVGTYMNMPRNLGFVKVGKEQKSKKWEVLSSGATEKGGFYTFGGGWSEQENKGINFLTSFTAEGQCVSRVKTARISKGRNLILYELWTAKTYVKSQAMVVDDNGTATQQPFDIGYPMQLPWADDMSIINGKVVSYAGTSDGQIIRYEVCSGASCPMCVGCKTTGKSGTSGSTGGSTTGATTAPIQMTGKLNMGVTLPNGTTADAFVKDAAVLKSVKNGIAAKVGCTASWVSVMLSVDSSSRRLAGEVAFKLIVDYTITVPSGESAAKVSSVQSALSGSASSDQTAWSSIINTELQKEKPDVTVTVTGVVSPTTAKQAVQAASNQPRNFPSHLLLSAVALLMGMATWAQ